MNNWQSDFGEARGSWISAKAFDGDGINLTYKSYSKHEPEDLDFIISGTQNEKIKDRKGNLILTKDNKEISNSYYDKKFPNGYQLRFEFEEGTLSCTSLPLLKEMHNIAPAPGDELHIRRDASDKTKTKYFIKKVEQTQANAPF